MDELCEGAEVDGALVARRGDELVAGGRRVGRVHDDERRIEWILPMGARLERRVRVEQALFDARSALLEARLRRVDPAPSLAAWLDLRGSDNPRLASLVAGLPPLEGARVLELGGSGEATRGFVRAGVSRIDQLDVSPGMQRLARARLDAREREHVVQHTTFAERLPFACGVFDLVYSRHCLHHMDRGLVIREVARVLKPSGALLALEPYLPRPLEPIVSLRRLLARAERGTDDPLDGRDRALFARWFDRVELRAEPALATLVRGWPALSRALRRRAVDARLPDASVRLVGGRLFALARSPRLAGRR